MTTTGNVVVIVFIRESNYVLQLLYMNEKKTTANLKWPQKMNEIFGDFILLNLALVQTLKLKKVSP